FRSRGPPCQSESSLSCSRSSAGWPKTIAPMRPLPIGSASDQLEAGFLYHSFTAFHSIIFILVFILFWPRAFSNQPASRTRIAGIPAWKELEQWKFRKMHTDLNIVPMATLNDMPNWLKSGG